GVGAVASLGTWGVLSVAGSASRFKDTFEAFGYQTYIAYETKFKSINFHVSSLRAFGNYNDLASVTARLPAFPGTGQFLATAPRPVKALDTVSISFPLFDFASLGAAFLRQETYDGKTSELLNLSYSRPMPYGASLYVTAFADLRDRRTSGIFAGLS